MNREQSARNSALTGEQIERAFEQLKLDEVVQTIEQQLLDKMLTVPSNDPRAVESFRVAININRMYTSILKGAIASGQISKQDLAAVEKAAKVKKGLF